MLFNWCSGVNASPLFKRAFPPRATTILKTFSGAAAASCERRHEYGLDRVHSVLRLGEHDRRLGFEDLVGDFHLGQAEALVDLATDRGCGRTEGNA
jgi:hypothetical protein